METLISTFAVAGDTIGDKIYPTNQEVYVVWAIGGLSQDGRVAKHDMRLLGKSKLLFRK